MPFNQGTLKSTISKVGGATKITVDFLGKKKGAVEIKTHPHSDTNLLGCCFRRNCENEADYRNYKN